MISARLLLDSTAQAIYGVDSQGICTFCNAACVSILGYDNADQLIGHNMHDLIHPSLADGTTIAAEECELLKDMNRQNHCANKMFFRVDSNSFPVEYWSYPILQDDQNLGQVVSFIDITKRKQMEETLRLQAQRAEALLELPRLADKYDEKSFMQRAQEMAEDLTSSKIAFIHFINDGGQEIELTTWSRRTLEHYCTAAYDSHYPVSKAGIWADALREGKPVIFNDYPNYAHKKGLPEGHSMLHRLISVPVIENGQVVMLAGVGNKDTNYSDCDSETVQLIASAIWQIVKKNRTVKTSQEAMERIERLARHVPGALYQFQLRPDGSFRFPYASWGIQSIYGVLPEQVVDDAEAAFKAVHPDDIGRLNKSIQESALTLSDWRDQYRVNLPDGRTIWIEGESTPEAQSDESILWHGYLRDITDQKKAEEAIRKKEETLRDIVESTYSGFWDWNLANNTEYLSPSFKKMFGYEDHELESSPEAWQKIIFPEDLPGVFEMFDRHVKSRGREPYYGEVRYRHRNGSTVWVICAGRVIEWAEDGTPIRMAGCHFDITARKAAEEETKRFKTIADSAVYGKAIADLDGNLVYVNNYLAELHGYAPEELHGKHLSIFHTTNQMIQVDNTINLSRQNGYFPPCEVWHVHRNGTEFPMLMSGVLLKDDHGNPQYIAASAVDITESKQAQLALEQKNEELEQFVYSVSHDLKSPLVTVKSFATMLRRDQQGGDQQQINKSIDYIDKAADKMQQLLDALLQYSRIGTVDTLTQTLSADQQVQNCLGALAGILQKHEVQVSISAMPYQLHGPPLHFGQLWQNLIENAVKYRGEQSQHHIEIGATQQDHDIVFYVRDNGMGIAPEHRERIFNLFSQLNPGSDGSGLGLALVKKIVSTYQGSIWVESAGEGKGSCFYFTLPEALINKQDTTT